MGSAGGPGPTFYETLGVETDASAAEIRDAYRRRAKDTHPDLNDAPDAGRQFQRVKRAHEVLGDAHERRRYDRLGHEAYVATDAVPTATDPREREASRGGRARKATDGRTRGGTTRGTRAGRETRDATRTDERGNHGGRPGTDAGGVRGEKARSDGDADLRGAEERATARERTGCSRTGSSASVGTVAYGLARWLRFAGALIDAWQSRLGPTGAAIALATFAAYPILLVSTVTSLFPLAVNALVGACTLALLGYLVVRPAVGVAVLGTWLLALPVALTISGIGVLSPAGLYSMVMTGVPFVLCVSTLLGASV